MAKASLVAGLPPLDSEGVLWIAAIDRVPIEDRIEWVNAMKKQVDDVNAMRAATLVDPAPVGGLRDWRF